MFCLRDILPRFNVVVANYESSESFTIVVYQGCYKRGEVEFSLPEIKTEPDKSWDSFPLLLYICGYGVINKSTEQAYQVVSDNERFMYTLKSNGTVCFVRKSQIEPLLEKLGNSLLYTECIDKDEDILSLSKNYYLSKINLKNLLRPDAVGSQLSIRLYEKIKLLVLITVLVMLLINFAASGSINKRYSETHALLTMLRSEKGRQDEVSKQEQGMLIEFNSGINSGFAYLSDCIGAAVPDSIILQSLVIQPPAKRIEEGKPFKVEASKIIIKGESVRAADISLFVLQLKNINKIRDLIISSVEQNRDGEALGFVIELEL